MSMQLNGPKPSFTVLTSTVEPPKPKKNKLVVIGLPLVAVLFIFSLLQLQFDYAKIAEGFTKLWGYMGTMFPPDFSDWKHVLLAAVESLQVAIIGSVLGIVVAFFLSFLAASNLTPHPLIAWVIKAQPLCCVRFLPLCGRSSSSCLSALDRFQVCWPSPYLPQACSSKYLPSHLKRSTRVCLKRCGQPEPAGCRS